RLVLLALADHDDAVHRHGVEHQPHRVDGRLVGSLLLPAADPAAGGEGTGLRDPDELEGEVPVRVRRIADVVGDDVWFGLSHSRRYSRLEGCGRFSAAPAAALDGAESAGYEDADRREQGEPVAEGEPDLEPILRLGDDAVVGD